MSGEVSETTIVYGFASRNEATSALNSFERQFQLYAGH